MGRGDWSSARSTGCCPYSDGHLCGAALLARLGRYQPALVGMPYFAHTGDSYVTYVRASGWVLSTSHHSAANHLTAWWLPQITAGGEIVSAISVPDLSMGKDHRFGRIWLRGRQQEVRYRCAAVYCARPQAMSDRIFREISRCGSELAALGRLEAARCRPVALPNTIDANARGKHWSVVRFLRSWWEKTRLYIYCRYSCGYLDGLAIAETSERTPFIAESSARVALEPAHRHQHQA